MPSPTPTYSTYTAITLTIPADGTIRELLGLLRAVNPRVTPRTKYVAVQCDITSTGTVLIGEAATDDQGKSNPSVLTSSNYGVKLGPGYSETFGGFREEDYNIARFWVLATGGSAIVNVQLVSG